MKTLYLIESMAISILFCCATVPPQVEENAWNEITLIINSEPNAEIFSVEQSGSPSNIQLNVSRNLGNTPLKIQLKYLQKQSFLTDIGAERKFVWFGNTLFGDDIKWNTLKDSNKYTIYNFYLTNDQCYDQYIRLKLDLKKDGKVIKIGNKDIRYNNHDKYVLSNIVMIPKPSVFNQQFAEAINKKDYYKAEELRLLRIDLLKNQIINNNNFWNTSFFELYPSKNGSLVKKIDLQLISSELDQLNHTVGLLDPQLMQMRSLLLKRLNDGDIDGAMSLAKAVSSMEEKYFNTIAHTQQINASSTQNVVVSQKPYYGAVNIVNAIAAMSGDKMSANTYVKSLGAAELMDVLGFGNIINK